MFWDKIQRTKTYGLSDNLSQMEQGKKVKARTLLDTKSRMLGLLCASYNCQQSNFELSVGRERRKGDVEKGL